MKFISRKCRRSIDHPRADIFHMTASYLNSSPTWPWFWFCIEGTSWLSSLFAIAGRICRISNAYTLSTKSAFASPVVSEWDHKIFRRSFAVSFWRSSSDDISLSLHFKTIMEGENYRKMLVALEMPPDQLFESGAGSTSASLSCLRGYQSNMAPGTVKRAITNFFWPCSGPTQPEYRKTNLRQLAISE